MSVMKILDRKAVARFANARQAVRERAASEAAALTLAGIAAARVVVVNEALSRVTELAYQVDGGGLVNVDPVSYRLRIPAPWGSAGWKYYGLRQWEGRALRRILWSRQEGHKSGRPPLYTYDADCRTWHLNAFDYGTLEAAGWWLKRSSITLKEWREVCQTVCQEVR